MLQKRYGVGFELSPAYFIDGCSYLRIAEEKVSAPTLFDTFDFAEDAPVEAEMAVAVSR